MTGYNGLTEQQVDPLWKKADESGMSLSKNGTSSATSSGQWRRTLSRLCDTEGDMHYRRVPAFLAMVLALGACPSNRWSVPSRSEKPRSATLNASITQTHS